MKRKFSKSEIYEYYEKTNTVFYFNKNDSNIIVPKYSKNQMRQGLNLNFANPLSYILQISIIALISLIVYFFKLTF